MAFFSVTSCPGCGTSFRVLWRVDESKLRPTAVIKLTCPLCGHRFDRAVLKLQVFANGTEQFPIGLPVRHLKLIYDCPHCGKLNVATRPMFTDCPDRELLRQTDYIQCDNPRCPGRGRPQPASVARILSA